MADPLQPKQSTAWNSDFPQVWKDADIIPEPACSGCPVASAHPSCSHVRLNHSGAESEIQNAYDIARWQWQLQRMSLIGSGVPGAYNGSYVDGWYPYNATGSTNFADASSWEVVSVSGRNVTLELEGGGDPRVVGLYSYRMPGRDGITSVPGALRTGCLQPGDVIQFSENSVISNSFWPVIVRIVSYDVPNSRVVVECDKEPTAALTKFPIPDGSGGWEPDPNPVTCRVWQHAGNAPKWHYIVKPDYFYGSRQSKGYTDSEIPEDGLVTIEPSNAVMHPGGFDPLNPTWVFEGRRRDNQDWETVPEANKRLYVLPDGPSVVAFRNEAPVGAAVVPAVDLSVDYYMFRITYYRLVDKENADCSIVGYARCKHSIPDVTDSDNGPGDGKAPGWMCMKRVIDVNTLSDEWDKSVMPPVPGQDGLDDTITHSYDVASGAANYPTHGRCLQHGMCSQFEPAEGHEVGTPYWVPEHGGKVLRELWGRCDMRLLRQGLGPQTMHSRKADRVGHNSIHYATGYVNLTTAYGLHDMSEWRGNGVWGLDYYVWEDIDGNQFLELQPGAFEGWRGDDPDSDFDGTIPDNVTGFETTRDPLDGTSTKTQNEMERIGVAVEKDSGALRDTGISHSSVALPAQNIIVPNININERSPQVRGNATFEWDGVGPAKITLKNLRQESKSDMGLGSRIVHSVVDMGNGLVQIVFENVQHSYSFINDGPQIGDSFDQIVTWHGGGGFPLMPKPRLQVNSYYEPNKYTGGRNTGAWPGDAIEHNGRKFIISSVNPYAGPAASDWGSTTSNTYSLVGTGFYIPPAADDYTIEYLSIKYLGGADLVPLADEEEKPVSIAAGHYWMGDDQALYFSAADNGQDIEIEFNWLDVHGVVLGNDTVVHNVSATVTVNPDIASSEYTGADSQAVYSNGVALTIVGSAGSVGSGQCHVDTSGADIALTTHIDQAGTEIRVVLTKNQPSPAPGDHYVLGGNLSVFGRNRDYIIAMDDRDGYLMTLTQGQSVSFSKGSACIVPDAYLDWTEYGTDNWQIVAPDYEVHHGNGEFLIPASWFADKPEVVCFRLFDVKWLDNRGIVSGAMWEKTRKTMEALTQRGWVLTQTGSGGRGQYIFSKTKNHARHYISVDCERVFNEELFWEEGGTPGKNYIQTNFDQIPSAQCSAYISSVGFGSFEALRFLPAGTEILSAWAEISIGGMVATFYRDEVLPGVDCNDDEYGWHIPAVNEELPAEAISYSIIGFTSEDDFEVIGKVAGAANGQRLINITDIARTMLAESATDKYPYGYGAVLLPSEMDKFEPPDLVEDWVEYDRSCQPGCPNGWQNWVSNNNMRRVEWGNMTIGQIAIKIKLPDEDRERMIIMDRWPAQHEVTP